MKLFLFAHPHEAMKTLEVLHAKKISEGLFIFNQGYVLLTGMGLFSALFQTTRFLQNYGHKISEIINLGFAGSLDPNLAIGTIVDIEKVEKWIEHPPLDQISEKIKEHCCPSFSLPHQGKKLISVEYSIFDSVSRAKLEKKADIVDMEGYSICFANQFFKKKLILRKVISDLTTTDGRERIKSNYSHLSNLLAQETLSFF